tara:strand:+ start:2446 stop:2904 length:459 start_codon:yes stop_codon:yes gene_type:complete
MKKKILITIFFLISLTNCGYTPVFYQSDVGFKISEINLKGENIINNFIRINLKRYTKKDYNIIYAVSAQTKYQKNVYSKNQAGDPTGFELIVETNFKIFKAGNLIKSLDITEKFIIQKLEDRFEENSYERSIKKNFAQSISSKLITELSNLK